MEWFRDRYLPQRRLQQEVEAKQAWAREEAGRFKVSVVGVVHGGLMDPPIDALAHVDVDFKPISFGHTCITTPKQQAQLLQHPDLFLVSASLEPGPELEYHALVGRHAKAAKQKQQEEAEKEGEAGQPESDAAAALASSVSGLDGAFPLVGPPPNHTIP